MKKLTVEIIEAINEAEQRLKRTLSKEEIEFLFKVKVQGR